MSGGNCSTSAPAERVPLPVARDFFKAEVLVLALVFFADFLADMVDWCLD